MTKEEPKAPSLLRYAIITGLLIGGGRILLEFIEHLLPFGYETFLFYRIGLGMAVAFAALVVCLAAGMYHRSKLVYFPFRRAYRYAFVALFVGSLIGGLSHRIVPKMLGTAPYDRSLDAQIEIESDGEGGEIALEIIQNALNSYTHSPLVFMVLQVLKSAFGAALLALLVAATIRHPIHQLRAYEETHRRKDFSMAEAP